MPSPHVTRKESAFILLFGIGNLLSSSAISVIDLSFNYEYKFGTYDILHSVGSFSDFWIYYYNQGFLCIFIHTIRLFLISAYA